MNKKHSIALIVYAGLLIVVSAIPLWVEREIASRALMFGCTVGVLCQVWGLLGLFGFRRRIGPGLTLGLTGFVLLAQTVTRWMPSSDDKTESLLFTIAVTLMLLVTLGLLGWMLPREEFPMPGKTGTGVQPSGNPGSDPKTTSRASSSARR